MLCFVITGMLSFGINFMRVKVMVHLSNNVALLSNHLLKCIYITCFASGNPMIAYSEQACLKLTCVART